MIGVGPIIGIARDDGVILSIGAVSTLMGLSILASQRRGSQAQSVGRMERAVLIGKILDPVSGDKTKYRKILSKFNTSDLREIHAELASTHSSHPSRRPR